VKARKSLNSVKETTSKDTNAQNVDIGFNHQKDLLFNLLGYSMITFLKTIFN
jgi:hypothetical protein